MTELKERCLKEKESTEMVAAKTLIAINDRYARLCEVAEDSCLQASREALEKFLGRKKVQVASAFGSLVIRL